MQKHLGSICCLIAVMLLMALFFVEGAVLAEPSYGAAEDVTDLAVIELSTGSGDSRVRDDDLESKNTLNTGEYAKVSFDFTAGYFYFEWYYIPNGGYLLIQLDGDDNVITSESFTSETGYLNHGIELLEETRGVIIESTGEGGALSTIRLYSAGEKPKSLQIWKPSATKTDLLIFSAHPDDEQLFFGTVTPLYAGERGYSAGIVYMSHQKRLRQSEAMAGMWLCGLDTYPTFAGFVDKYSTNLEDAMGFWGEEKTLEYVVEQLRRYKPEVVVTHDPEGEYGHGAHRLTAATLRKAVEIANDPEQFKSSADEYGVWQVKKLYLHIYGDNQVELPYDEPLTAFDGKTAFEMAVLGYDCHKSQHQYWFYVSTDNEYSCAKFGLAYSTVGEDVLLNDLFENIPESALSTYVPPTPEPTPTPTPTPIITEAPTPEPTPTPTLTVDVIQTLPPAEEKPILNSKNALRIGALIIGVITSIALFFIAFFRLAKKSRVFAAIVCLIPMLAGILVFFTACQPGGIEPVVTLEPIMTEEPTVEITLAPTIAVTPTLEPTPEPTPTEEPHPWAEFFINDSNRDQVNEYGEIIVVDAENNHWEYRTDKLSVIISRVVDPKKPLVYVVAHIRMLEENAFYSGFATDEENGTSRLWPHKFCRRYGAVLGITGDNLINNEVELKGILIRNGRIYSRGGDDPADTMAMMPDMTMQIFKPGEVTADELLEMGVRDTFSFGPTLIEGGEINPNVEKSRVNHVNPRCGIGMVEPGHFVAVTVDGRQTGYSRGLWMKEFAELMLNLGCTVAYNLDGGDSTQMVFLGECLNRHIGLIGYDTQRYWPDGLLWGVSPSVPGVDDPVYYNGNNNVPAITMSPSPAPDPTPTDSDPTQVPDPTQYPDPTQAPDPTPDPPDPTQAPADPTP